MRAQHSRGVPVWLWLTPVVLMFCALGALLASVIPGLILQSVGFAPQGSVEEFWEQNQRAEIAFAGTEARVAIANPTLAPIDWFRQADVPDTVRIEAGSAGSVTISSAEAFVEALWVGDGADGDLLGVVQYREEAWRALCDAWLNGCSTGQYSLVDVDLRPGGLVLYGSVSVGGLWQNGGVALTLDPSGIGLEVTGLVVDGTLYALPTEGDIADLVNQWVSEANAALHQLNVQAGGYTLTLAEIRITDEQLTLILR